MDDRSVGGSSTTTNQSNLYLPNFSRSQSLNYSNGSNGNTYHSQNINHNGVNNFMSSNINNFMGTYQGPPIPSQFSNNFNVSQTIVPPPINLPTFGNHSKAQLYQNWGVSAFSSLNPINYHGNYSKRESAPIVPLKFEKI
jgi:hypothetical protein